MVSPVFCSQGDTLLYEVSNSIRLFPDPFLLLRVSEGEDVEVVAVTTASSDSKLWMMLALSVKVRRDDISRMRN